MERVLSLNTVKLTLEKFKLVLLSQQLMLGSKIHNMNLATQDSCLIIHIPKSERCVAEIALYSSV
jgi:hypothetical protein